MKALAAVFFFLLRLICYVMLAIVIVGIGSMVLVSVLDVCPTLHEGGISCNAPLYQHLAEFGMAVLLVTVFTGFPGLFAIGGLIFLAKDIAAWRRRRSVGEAAGIDIAPSEAVRSHQAGEAKFGKTGWSAIVIKGFLILMGIAFVGGAIAGILDHL